MTCPICGKPAQDRYRPFCSRRCADVDLGRWLTGAHVLPGEPVGEGEGDDGDGEDGGTPPAPH